MDNKLEYKTYNTGKVFFEEGWYSKEYLESIIEAIARQDKHTKEMMGIKE